MARRRAVERDADARGVPVALLDHESIVWRDPKLFAAWMAQHVPGVLPYPVRRQEIEVDRANWCTRLNLAVTEWAIANEFTLPRNPRFPDRARLAEVGVRYVSSLRRAREYHELRRA